MIKLKLLMYIGKWCIHSFKLQTADKYKINIHKIEYCSTIYEVMFMW